MIAVATNPERRAAAEEFFQLFKTAWEFYHAGEEYDVVICDGIEPTDIRAKLMLVYSSSEISFDREHQLKVVTQGLGGVVEYREQRLPIYRALACFSGETGCDLVDDTTKAPIAAEIISEDRSCVRMGYDLFAEVDHLLSRGQPSEFAQIPSVEMHIAILRDLLVEHQIPFEEIPPVPAGYNFIVCLTHDVDHFAIRNHKLDHTMFGFLYRASVGSLIDVVRGRKSLRQLRRNWIAVSSLPLVYLGILPDFWSKPERYLELESASTFFVIPKAGSAGLTSVESRSRRRAAKYKLSQLETSVGRILAQGGEVGVHGIDAWRDIAEATKEREQIQSLTRSSEIGIRMHWLFFDFESPLKLEEAGYSYDSTIGYNETVGYRAGTTQAFKPLTTKRLLELPLHIMDTALFYRTHLNLSSKQAMQRLNTFVKNAKQFGGLLMINWHDRSIAPERLWDDIYIGLIESLQAAGAWFCTAGEAAQWFRNRRAIDFKEMRTGESGMTASASKREDRLPGLRVRSYRTGPRRQRNVGRDRNGGFAFYEKPLNADANQTAVAPVCPNRLEPGGRAPRLQPS